MRDMPFAGAVCLFGAVGLFALIGLTMGQVGLSGSGTDSALIILSVFDAALFTIGVMLIALDKVRDAILRKLEGGE